MLVRVRVLWVTEPNFRARVLTAASASAKIFRDFSRSFFNCEASAISEARKRRFSTWRTDICALSSSIRTLSVEFNLLTRESYQ